MRRLTFGAPRRQHRGAAGRASSLTEATANIQAEVRAAAPRRWRVAALSATLIAVLGWTTLIADFWRWLAYASATGVGLVEAVIVYFRFFTILTNCGVAVLMSVTAVALWRRRPLPAASLFRGAVVYMAVTSLTYELLLRALWSPQGLLFVTDLALHDVLPAATFLFWLAFAPKASLQWRTLPWLLAYPGAYLAMTLIAGALGAGYPYDFLDAAKLGYPLVVAIAGVFLAAFIGLGAALTAAAPAIMGGRSAAA